MPYLGAPTSTNNDGIRLAVGDLSTTVAGQMLSSADYTFIRTLAGDYASRVVIAARMVGAKFADGSIMKKVGDLTIQKGERVTFYKNLADQWERRALAGVAPYLGGRSLADKDSVEDDTDRNAPAFQRGAFDFPGTADPQRSTGL